MEASVRIICVGEPGRAFADKRPLRTLTNVALDTGGGNDNAGEEFVV